MVAVTAAYEPDSPKGTEHPEVQRSGGESTQSQDQDASQNFEHDHGEPHFLGLFYRVPI